MTAWLGDRRAFDPGTWDADQERAARDAVVETAAGRVVRTVRPHVVEALVRTMFGYEPTGVLPAISVPIVALVARGGADREPRLRELRRTAAARAGVGPLIRVSLQPSAHNLMRYRPAEVAAAILVGGR